MPENVNKNIVLTELKTSLERYARRALIFCPWIDGHRQNYCCVIANWFLKSGFCVLLAAGRTPQGERADDTPLIGTLVKKPNVMFYDLGNCDGSHADQGRWVCTVRELEATFIPDWTFFPTGDEIRLSLKGLGQKDRMPQTKRAAIFIYAQSGYSRDYSDKSSLIRMHHKLRDTVHKFREYIYFKHKVWSQLGLNIAFITNPDFIDNPCFGHYHYLPEIYRAWEYNLDPNSDYIKRLCVEYSNFLQCHFGKQVLLYYGGWQVRRGYDILMNLACKEPDTVFVSCGRLLQNNEFQFDVESMRTKLREENRLFEIETSFLPENKLVDLLYESADFVVLPYRHFYGMSGSLIQAASYGKPVLVPDIGYLRSMVSQYGIGITYRHGNFIDFYNQFKMIRRSYRKYINNALQFSEDFTYNRICAALDSALLRNEAI